MHSQEVEPLSQPHASQRRHEFPAEGLDETEVCKSDFEEASELSPQRKRPAKRPSAASTKKEDAVTITVETPADSGSGHVKSYRSVSLSPSLVTEV